MCMSTPLLPRRSCCARVEGREGPCHSIDEFLELGRYGKNGRWPGQPTLLPLMLLGVSAYGMAAPVILQPTFLDDEMRAEWFFGGDQDAAKVLLAGVSSAFFLLWGVGTLACTVLADRIGRKPTLLGGAIAMLVLSCGCALAPSFRVYAVCRALCGVPVGAQGAVAFVLIIEWALPRDNALVTCALMLFWSVCALLLVGLMYATEGAALCRWQGPPSPRPEWRQASLTNLRGCRRLRQAPSSLGHSPAACAALAGWAHRARSRHRHRLARATAEHHRLVTGRLRSNLWPVCVCGPCVSLDRNSPG